MHESHDGPVLSTALRYAARGWPVFPCDPSTAKGRGKRPLVGRGGLHQATDDPDQIRRWWTRWPNALIGVATGPRLGAFVVDIDVRDGADETDILVELGELALCQHFDWAPASRTQSGGLHLWFAYPAGESLGNRAGLIEHVDVRGDGGYVIVPPSRMADGNEYTWLRPPDGGFPPAPERLVDAILRRGDFAPEARAASPGARAAAPAAAAPDERVRKLALRALNDETHNVSVAPTGQRNHRLNVAAYNLGQLIGAGALTAAAVRAALFEAATVCGLLRDDGERSVAATIESGIAAGAAQPRDLRHLAQPPRRRRPPQPPPPGDPATPPGDGKPPHGRGSDGAGGGRGGAPGDGAGGGDDDGGDGVDPEVVAACSEEPQNDTGNGKRLLAHFGDRILHVREVGWHYWTGTHWEREGADEAVVRFAQRTAARIALEAPYVAAPTARQQAVLDEAAAAAAKPRAQRSEEEQRKVNDAAEIQARLQGRYAARIKFAVSSGNASRINAMISQALPHCTVAPDAMDSDPLAFNCLSGTLRFVREPDPDCPDPDAERFVWAVRLDAHDRSDLLSKCAPVRYDPTGPVPEAPRWREFLDLFQPNERVRTFLRDFHGYALTAETADQVFVYHWGTGANGKSTFLEALAGVMGPYAHAMNAESFIGQTQSGDKATPDFAQLHGVRWLRVSELPAGEPLKESLIKGLTGGDVRQVRHLNKEFWPLKPVFKASMAGNSKPEIRGVDYGIWRRVLLVPWTVRMAADDPRRKPFAEVQRMFEAERPGILAWLIEGALDYLNAGRLQPPEEVVAATAEHQADMDPVGRYIAACVRDAPGERVQARAMFDGYCAWCAANSVRHFSEKRFAQIMQEKGYRRAEGRLVHYLDVALHDVPEPPVAAQRDEDRDYWGGR